MGLDMILTHGANSINVAVESPDIPPEYRHLYRQVQYVKNGGNSYCKFDNQNMSSEDIVEINSAVAWLHDARMYLFVATSGVNLSGNHVIVIETDPVYYPNNCSIWWTLRSGVNIQKSAITGIQNNSVMKIVSDYPYLRLNDTAIYLATSSLTPNNAVSVGIFGAGSSSKEGLAIGIVRVYDRATGVKKAEFIPCENKTTNKFGFFDTFNNVWVGNSSVTTDYLSEFTLPKQI